MLANELELEGQKGNLGLDKYLSGLPKVDIYGPPSENVSRL